ncbi:hypothetical protein WSS_A30904 [Rhodococcus opacus M213]|uniref:Uncharacterized protein n=1 Tax=Rhodococcus opacus M213 TaxID=1129896 RepID=K8XB40_RHOOP|nr:hypothetical protein WSS_A30904 [Rhodococcus opacus M213]
MSSIYQPEVAVSVSHTPLLDVMNARRARPLLERFGQESSEGAAYRVPEIPTVAAGAANAGFIGEDRE